MRSLSIHPRQARFLQIQAQRAWDTLKDHPEGFSIGDRGMLLDMATLAQGWEIVIAGPVIIAVDDQQLYAVGEHTQGPWAVPIGEIEQAA